MAPIDLREHELPVQAALGFHRGRTEELLTHAADTIERLNRELGELRAARDGWTRERELLEHRLEEAGSRAERLVGEAMLDAHKAGQALRAEAEAEAERLRGEAESLLAPARRESERIVDDARRQAEELVAAAEAECGRLAVQTEQYKLLMADVQRRSRDVLQRALTELEGGFGHADAAAGEQPAPFRSAERQWSDEAPLSFVEGEPEVGLEPTA